MIFEHITYLTKDLTARWNKFDEVFVWERHDPETGRYRVTGQTSTLPGIGHDCWPMYAELLEAQGEHYPIEGLLYWYPEPNTQDCDLWRIYLTPDVDLLRWSNPLQIIAPDGSSIYPASIIEVTPAQEDETRGTFRQSVAYGPRTWQIPEQVRHACRVIFDSLDR